MDVVKPCNFARKRQAVLECCSEQQRMKKRPCLEDSSWLTENTCNMETENRLILCSSSPPVTEPPYPPHHYVCNQPLTNPSSMALNVHVDVNCNLVNEGNNTQEMEVSCESANSAQSHVQLHHIPTAVMANRSSLPYCPRCLRGEPGHINHLSN